MKLKNIVNGLMVCVAVFATHDVVADIPSAPSRVIVTFESNDGMGRTIAKWVRRHSTLKLPACPFRRLGYTFVGWEDDSGVYLPGEKVYVSYGLTFKANWKELWSTKAMSCSIALLDEYRVANGLVAVNVGRPNAKTGISSVLATVTLPPMSDGKSPRKISFRGKTNDGFVSMHKGKSSLVLRMDGSGEASAEYYDNYSYLHGSTDGRSISLPSGTYYVTAMIGCCQYCPPYTLYPQNVPMYVGSNRWTVLASSNENPRRLKLSYNAKTGQFSGTFKGYLCRKTNFKILGAVNNGEAIGFVSNVACPCPFYVSSWRE